MADEHAVEGGRSERMVTLEDARGWSGLRLDELGGDTVGRIAGVLVDDHTGEPEWLLARIGRFGNHTVVPARDAVEGVGHVWVPYSREQIRRAPKMEPGASLTGEAERRLLSHYGIAGNAGRHAELDAGSADAVTARPAD
jgi:hypothetical protein